jgi:transcriptional regulator with PAS, ATPase and Fis domain
MNPIQEAKEYIQEYTETIAQVLEIEATIVDQDCLRAGGTGPYRQQLGMPIPHGSFYQRILKTLEPGVIEDNHEAFACQACEHRKHCGELATIGYPIILNNAAVGVIGLIAFTEEQKKKIKNNAPKLLQFLGHMANLLQSKLQLAEQNRLLEKQMQETLSAVNQMHAFQNMLGNQANFLAVLQKAQRAALGTSTVLITGESGTGKELLARAIHSSSNRNSKPFIAVNCSSIPEALLESELFGYEEGAFTGAKRQGKPGKFELAQGGTLFLDEIGDLPLAMQPKLLRVLQERVIDRVGGSESIPVDVRIIAATNKNLTTMVEAGEFREELFYRLHVIPLRLPPLRERREDIELLALHFLHKYVHLLGKQPHVFSESLLSVMECYSWPGNLRQLENAVEYMVNMARTPIITVEDAPDYLKGSMAVKEQSTLSLEKRLSEYEKAIIKEALKNASSTQDKVSVAKLLGISQATLYRKLNEYDLLKK